MTKLLFVALALIFGLICSAQENKGKLLLIRVDIERDLKIDKKQFAYFVMEIGEDANPNSNTKSIRAFFDGYTDENITSCIQKDSVRLATFYSGNNYKHEEKYFKQYSELLEKYVTKMQGLMTMNVKSSLYNEKVKISYILMQAHYCKGIIAKKDLKIMGVEPEVILIIDEITFDTKFRIPREFTYDIIKAIDFNKFLY